ncbi:MAG: DUF3826 domain-containing protein [Cyclobacteriaceae bacterium]
MKKLLFTIGILFIGFMPFAQNVNMSTVNPEYIKVLEGRTAKFLTPMELEDNFEAIQAIVVEQYCNLSAIHDSCDARKVAIRPLEISKEEKDQMIVNYENERDAKLYIRHNAYLAQLLGAGLTYEQVDEVKNGMTYGVLPITYTGYLDMLLELTERQKNKIWVSLYEARERAMDQGSSDDKHKMFGKYKGRINNYLSKEGYDLNAESQAWHERMRKAGKKF